MSYEGPATEAPTARQERPRGLGACRTRAARDRGTRTVFARPGLSSARGGPRSQTYGEVARPTPIGYARRGAGTKAQQKRRVSDGEQARAAHRERAGPGGLLPRIGPARSAAARRDRVGEEPHRREHRASRRGGRGRDQRNRRLGEPRPHRGAGRSRRRALARLHGRVLRVRDPRVSSSSFEGARRARRPAPSVAPARRRRAGGGIGRRASSRRRVPGCD